MSNIRIMASCGGMECFLFIYGSNSYAAAIAYRACEDVVLGHGCVVFLY